MIEGLADKLVILVSATLFLCYVSNIFYAKTKIPDIIFVLGFGMLLGPVLGVFDEELFLAISPLMSIVALSVILFDAGINVDIRTLVKTMPKAAGLAVATFLAVVASTGPLISFVLPSSFTLLQALLLGCMVGGTSTLAVFGILSGLEKLIPDIKSTRVILMMESVLSDPICIIASITLIRMIMLPGISVEEGLRNILYVFLISSLLGFGVGFVWVQVLDRLRGRAFNYIMTIALLLPTYIGAEKAVGEGGGPMAALTFGLMLSNYRYVFWRIGARDQARNLRLDKKRLQEFHEEITFFVKAFFFVYVGLIVTLTVEYVLIGSLLVVVLLLVRFIVASLVGRVLHFSRQETVLSRLIFAQGLPAFVMSQLPLIFDPQRRYFLNPEIYPDLAMPIVLGTILFGAIVGPVIAKRQLAPKGEQGIEKR